MDCRLDMNALEEKTAVTAGPGEALEWNSDWQGTTPGVNDMDDDDYWDGATPHDDVEEVSSQMEAKAANTLGWWIVSNSDNYGCGGGVGCGVGDGGQGVMASFAAPTTFPSPPLTILTQPHIQTSSSRPVTAHSHLNPSRHLPQYHQHYPQHHHTFHHTRPSTAPGLVYLPRATFAPFPPPRHTATWGVAPFTPPDLVVEELPDTWSTQAAGLQNQVLTSPLVLYPSLAQSEILSSPSSSPAVPYWSYTPHSTSHSTHALVLAHTPVTPLSHPPMSIPATAVPHVETLSQSYEEAVCFPDQTEPSTSLPVPMTTSAASSPSLSSPRIETPNLSQSPGEVVYSEMDDRPTTAGGNAGLASLDLSQ